MPHTLTTTQNSCAQRPLGEVTELNAPPSVTPSTRGPRLRASFTRPVFASEFDMLALPCRVLPGRETCPTQKSSKKACTILAFTRAPGAQPRALPARPGVSDKQAPRVPNTPLSFAAGLREAVSPSKHPAPFPGRLPKCPGNKMGASTFHSVEFSG